MKKYRNGPYQVTVADDGAIKVRAKDWLSKYSAAIHNDFFHIYEYGRKNRSGTIEPVKNVNLIISGETLYHLPTYHTIRKPMIIRATRPPISVQPPPKVISDSEKKKIIIGTLKKDFNLRGDNLPILSKAIDILGYADNALELASIAGLLAEGGLIATVGTATSLASVFLFPVGAAIAICNAWETGQRMYGMRAVAYATTAWSFGDPIPKQSAEIIRNMRKQFPKDEPIWHKAWKEASEKAQSGLVQDCTKRNVTKKIYQLLLRAVGNNNRQELCKALLRGFEKEYKANTLDIWKSLYSVEYSS